LWRGVAMPSCRRLERGMLQRGKSAAKEPYKGGNHSGGEDGNGGIRKNSFGIAAAGKLCAR
jgi:hypothetical protein